MNSLDFVKGDFVRCSIVKLGAANGLMGCNFLSVLDATTIGQVSRNASSSKRVAANVRRQPCLGGTSFDHSQSVVAVHSIQRQLTISVYGSEQRPFRFIPDSSCIEICFWKAIG